MIPFFIAAVVTVHDHHLRAVWITRYHFMQYTGCLQFGNQDRVRLHPGHWRHR